MWIKEQWYLLFKKKEPLIEIHPTEESELELPPPKLPSQKVELPPKPPSPKIELPLKLPSPKIEEVVIKKELKLVRGVWKRLETRITAELNAKEKFGIDYKAHLPKFEPICQLVSEQVVMFQRPAIIKDVKPVIVEKEPTVVEAPLSVVEAPPPRPETPPTVEEAKEEAMKKKLILLKGVWTRLATRVNQHLDFLEERHTNLHAVPPTW
jgi:hypothetical protein